jgi:hypothetical protein
MFRADELLLALTCADVRFVIIGGIAVGAHGYAHATRDLDIVPDSDPANLARLAHLLAEIDAEHVGLGDFPPDEFPVDPLDPDQLAQGANFRLNTSLEALEIIQWIAGIDADPAYPVLARDAIKVAFRGHELLVTALGHLRAMKMAAGREQDLLDLPELEQQTAPREPRLPNSREEKTVRPVAVLSRLVRAELAFGRRRCTRFHGAVRLLATGSTANTAGWRSCACRAERDRATRRGRWKRAIVRGSRPDA